MKKGLFSCLLMVLSSFSFADWQYTRWGMSPDEVVVASSNQAIINNDRGQDSGKSIALLRSNYKSDLFEFNVFFNFDKESKKLNRIALRLNNGDCKQLGEVLIAQYKNPTKKETGMLKAGLLIYSWDDERNNNKFSLVVVGDKKDVTCSIIYKPIDKLTDNGL